MNLVNTQSRAQVGLIGNGGGVGPIAVSLALLVLLWQWQPLGSVVWDVQNDSVKAVLLAGSAIGWWLVLMTTFVIDLDLFGLRESWTAFTRARHPLYVGWMFACWSAPTVTVTHLLCAAVATDLVLIAILREKRDFSIFRPSAAEPCCSPDR